jgi:hypothetical protein
MEPEYGENERDLMIAYCDTQLYVIRNTMLPSRELKFRLHGLFFGIQSEGTQYLIHFFLEICHNFLEILRTFTGIFLRVLRSEYSFSESYGGSLLS